MVLLNSMYLNKLLFTSYTLEEMNDDDLQSMNSMVVKEMVRRANNKQDSQ